MSKVLAHSANVLANLSGANTQDIFNNVDGVETVAGATAATASIEAMVTGVVTGAPAAVALSNAPLIHAKGTIMIMEGAPAASIAAIPELLL